MLGIQSPVGQAPVATPVAPVAAAPMARPVTAAAPAQAPAQQQAKAQKHTVLGMPAATGTSVEEAIAQAKAKAQALAAAQAQAQAPRPEGVETIAAAPAATAALDLVAAQAASRPRPETVPLEAVPAQQPAPQDEWPDDDYGERRPGRRGPGLLILVIVAGLLILGGVGAILYLLVWKGGDGGPQPQIFPNPAGGGITVVLPLPGAPPGAVLQVEGQQVPVLGGQARFDLPLAPLQLGVNEIQATYSAPGRAPEPRRFPVTLRHKAAEDLSGLSTADPYFEVLFQTAPGVQLAVAGTPVQAVGGLFRHRVALSQVAGADDPKADSLIHTVPFSLMAGGGVAEQGQHVITLPLPRLQIDRPGLEAMVDRAEVTVSGVTEPGAQITVNGTPAGVTATGFSTAVPLPEPGEHVIQIAARAPGKAPRLRRIKVVRVANLAPVIEDWSRDLNRKLDYPAIARDPNSHIEKKVALSGRVVNINTEKGVTAFLLYIGEGCPAGARCAVYVDYNGETEAGLQSNVTVYGTVGGTRDVDLRGGGKETMPSVQARFVVLDEAATPKKPARR
jgi:hypothetical protein